MSTQANILNDLSTATKLPNKVLNALTDKEMLCIGSAIHDALMLGEEATVLNLGFGTLSINLVSMDCKFIPSNELKSIIKKCINGKIDPFEQVLEQEVIDKLLKTYEEVF